MANKLSHPSGLSEQSWLFWYNQLIAPSCTYTTNIHLPTLVGKKYSNIRKLSFSFLLLFCLHTYRAALPWQPFYCFTWIALLLLVSHRCYPFSSDYEWKRDPPHASVGASSSSYRGSVFLPLPSPCWKKQRVVQLPILSKNMFPDKGESKEIATSDYHVVSTSVFPGNYFFPLLVWPHQI